MDGHFDEMLRRLKLTKKQKADAKAKYEGVSKHLHKAFYDTEYDGSTKLLIGSYGKRTNNRPPGDVDLLFKIPAEIYVQYSEHQTNGPSALLQYVRGLLKDKYPATEKVKAWGKVVLIEFPEGKHNIELLPAYEIDGVFQIPNSENGGSWDSFDARADLAVVSESHKNTGGKTRPLIKILKRWLVLNKTLTLKSFELEKFCADFLNTEVWQHETWSELLGHFFWWLDQRADYEDRSYIQTAISRASTALDYEMRRQPEKACDEWRKIFGIKFPVHDPALERKHLLTQQFPSDAEQFIEDLHPFKLKPEYQVNVKTTLTGKGFRPHFLHEFLAKYSGIPRHLSLKFQAVTNVPGAIEVLWKVRNFGAEAKQALTGKGLRGEITGGSNQLEKSESSLYKGVHYVECYIIKDGVCVAKKLQFVPISGDNA